MKWTVPYSLCHANTLDHICTHSQDPRLRLSVEKIRAQLPDNYDIKSQTFRDWWKLKVEDWTAQLLTLLVEYRKIGHDWKFTTKQKHLLQQYYDANRLLIKCLKINCDIGCNVKEQIEDNLLLPIAELKRRLPDQYGGIENAELRILEWIWEK